MLDGEDFLEESLWVLVNRRSHVEFDSLGIFWEVNASHGVQLTPGGVGQGISINIPYKWWESKRHKPETIPRY